MKVDCTACHHVPLLRLEALLRVGLAARPTFFTQKAAVAVRQEGAGDGFGKGARAGRVNGGGSSGAPGLRPRSRGRQRQWPEASKTPQPCAAQLRPANSHPP